MIEAIGPGAAFQGNSIRPKKNPALAGDRVDLYPAKLWQVCCGADVVTTAL